MCLMNCFRYQLVSSLFLAGQLPILITLVFRISPSFFSPLHWNIRWSNVCVPCLHGHSGFPIILNRCKYDRIFPWPVIIVVTFGLVSNWRPYACCKFHSLLLVWNNLRFGCDIKSNVLVSVHAYRNSDLESANFPRWIRNSIPALRCPGLINHDRKLLSLGTPDGVTENFRRHFNETYSLGVEILVSMKLRLNTLYSNAFTVFRALVGKVLWCVP
jgi:hypothetical protein